MNDLEYYKRRVSELEEECAKKQRDINNLEEENGRLQACVDTYRNYILPRATKEAYEMIERNQFVGIKIVTCEEWETKRKDINSGQDQKGFTAEFLPTEPIKVADMLVEKFHETSRGFCACEEMFKQENKMLRQIAEHLLVYCKHNSEANG